MCLSSFRWEAGSAVTDCSDWDVEVLVERETMAQRSRGVEESSVEE